MTTQESIHGIGETATAQASRAPAFPPQRHKGQDGTSGLARTLGWFSIGLGLAEVLAPRRIARLTGTRNHTGWIRAFGVREIASGVGILNNHRPAPWVWARVGGDVLDLAALGKSLTARGNDRGKAVASVAAVAGVTALDVLCARQVSTEANVGHRNGFKAAVVVQKTPDECYRVWRNFEQLPQFMNYLQAVHVMDEKRSHWVALAPGNTRIEWDAEIVDDAPGQRILWRSLPGGDVSASGSVHFREVPAGRGCLVKVEMHLGGAAKVLAPAGKLMGRDPEQMIDKDLRRFKQLMETGEIITTEGQPAGRASGTTWLDSIAR